MRRLHLLPLCLLVCAVSAHAAKWVTVASDRVRRVELNQESVLPSDPGTKVAWGRIVLSDEQAKLAGYKIVQALNRYDCRTRSFVVLRRTYLTGDDRTVREETIGKQDGYPVRPGTVDERFFDAVCKSESVADLRKIAQQAASEIARAKELAKGTGSVRRADIRLAKDEPEHASAPVKPITPGAQSAPKVPAAAPRMPSAAEAMPAPRPVVQPAPVRRPVPRPAAMMTPATPATPRPMPPLPAALPATTAASTPTAPPGWSYDGPGGPQNWGSLKPEYAACAKGGRQSPIDIRDGIKVDQEAIAFDYQPSYFRIVDTGHTIQVNYGNGSTIKVMGRTYELQQITFHHPSEMRVDGKSFDMEAHLIHKDAEGHIAVVAVLLERGAANPLIQTLWNNLPLEQHDEYKAPSPIRIADLLPENRGYYAFMGSLTTPPCSEGVLWLVMKQPVQISPDQIGIFARFYSHNARPVQPSADRIIKESR